MRARKLDRLELRTDPFFLLAIDDWRRRQPDAPSRSEAIRRLIEIGLDHATEERHGAKDGGTGRG